MTQARTSRIVGVVLRARTLGEADRVFTLLSRERGKIEAVAKGVRRSGSALSGRLEFMNGVALELHHGRSLDIITSAEVHASRFQAIVEPEAFAAASLIAEYVDACCEFEQPVPEVFSLLCGVLKALEQSSQPMLLLPRFELRLLHAIGLGPQFEHCVRCGIALDCSTDTGLDLEDGGLACSACRSHLHGLLDVSAADMENLRALGRPTGRGMPVTLHASAHSARIIERLLTHHLGARPRVQLALDLLRALPLGAQRNGDMR